MLYYNILLVRVFLILIIVSLLSCNSFQKNDNKNQNSILNENQKIVNPILLKEIRLFIRHVDVSESSRKLNNIFIVKFSGDFNDCYISIKNDDSYYIKGFDGYILESDYMIAFYYTNNKCNTSFVDTPKLQKNVKNIYKKAEDLIISNFEPEFKAYKVHSKDSIELIYYGNVPDKGSILDP
jgi:hypothetical protein